MKTRILTLGILAGGAFLTAGPAGEPTIDGKAAFARLKALAGEWQADSSMGKVQVTYEAIAGGSVVVERDSMTHMGPMITMYHLDGLILTHYCMMGSQPRLLARAFNEKTGELRFEFLDATNLARKNAGHMHNATIRMADNQHITADWEFYTNGQKSNTEAFQYTRVR
jgi:hypothetical protein